MIRLATPEEAQGIYEDKTCPSLVVVSDEEGQITGHLCLSVSNGEVFGHNTKVWSSEPTTAARLWLFARKTIRDMGITHVNVHFDDETPEPIKAFWKRLGFKKIMEIHRGDI